MLNLVYVDISILSGKICNICMASFVAQISGFSPNARNKNIGYTIVANVFFLAVSPRLQDSIVGLRLKIEDRKLFLCSYVK